MIRVPRALFDWLTLGRCIAILVVVSVGYALLVYRASHAGPTALAMAFALAPLAVFALVPALIALFPEYIGWVDERTMRTWQGRYHAFDDHQIRVVEARDRLWFSSADVHGVLGMPRRDGVLKAMNVSEIRQDEEYGEMLLTIGLRRLLGRSTERQAQRLLVWAERDVGRPWQKKRDGLVVQPDPPSPPTAVDPGRPRRSS